MTYLVMARSYDCIEKNIFLKIWLDIFFFKYGQNIILFWSNIVTFQDGYK